MRDLQQLVVTGLLADYATLIELIRLVHHHDCQVLDMQTQHPGTHYTITLFLQGKWSAIAKMETGLKKWQQKDSLLLHCQRTTSASLKTPAITYLLYLSTTEEADILYRILAFLHEAEIALQNIHVERYISRYTYTPIIHITLRIHLSIDLTMGEWRERLMLFCDDLNIDAALEPEKG